MRRAAWTDDSRLRVARLAFIAFGAVIGALAGLHPLEVDVVDPVLSALAFAVVVWAASRVPRGILSAAAVAAAFAVPVSWATLCLVAVAAIDVVGHGARRSDTMSSAAGVLLVLACTGLVDREFVHQSAAAASVSLAVVVLAAVLTLPRRHRVTVLTVAGGIVAIGAATSALFALRALDARSRVSDAVEAVNTGIDAALNGDADVARDRLRAASANVAEARRALDTWWLTPTRLVPVVAPNARVTVDTLTIVDRALTDLVDSVEGIGFEALSFADGRVDLDEVERVGDRLTAANGTVSRLAAVTADRSVWLVDDLTTRLDQLETRLVDLSPTLDDATAALEVLPAILGGDGERRYLLVFVTPSEARAGGGFAGNWAEITASDGRIELVEQGRAGELNPPSGTQWSIEGQDEYLTRYDEFGVRTLWQNVTMSPDFPTVGDVMAQIFPQATGRQVDGVIRLGPQAMEALLRITGPVTVEGRDTPLGADEAVEFLTRDQYAGVFADNQSRVDYLGNTVEAVFDVLTSRGLGNPVAAARELRVAIDSGDLVMRLPRPAETDLVDRLGMSGALPSPSGGDVVTVVQHNPLANKIDAWSQRSIVYDVQVDPEDGSVAGVVTVLITNSAPVDGTDVQVAGQTDGLPRATMREYVTIYSPHSIDITDVDGRRPESDVQPELGLRATTVEVIVPPGESVRINGYVFGDDVLDANGVYRLSVPPNPAVQPDLVTIRINNRRVFKGVLDRTFELACTPTVGDCR